MFPGSLIGLSTLRSFALSALALLLLAASCAARSNADVPTYQVENGSYHLMIPDGGATAGVVMHLHGAVATGRRALRGELAREAIKRGYAIIAPNGEHADGRFRNNWSVRARGSSFARDDIAFLRSVLQDVRERHNLSTERLLLTGFSRGASMTWDIACQAPDMATAFAPVAGAFWTELPSDCEQPVDLFHIHGWIDRTVPLEGRVIPDSILVQGDVFASLFVLRRVNGCDARQPERSIIKGDRWWRHWTDCKEGSISLMLHPGGDRLPDGWSREILNWFEQLQR